MNARLKCLLFALFLIAGLAAYRTWNAKNNPGEGSSVNLVFLGYGEKNAKQSIAKFRLVNSSSGPITYFSYKRNQPFYFFVDHSPTATKRGSFCGYIDSQEHYTLGASKSLEFDCAVPLSMSAWSINFSYFEGTRGFQMPDKLRFLPYKLYGWLEKNRNENWINVDSGVIQQQSKMTNFNNLKN